MIQRRYEANSEKALAALRQEAEAQLDSQLQARLLSRVELSASALALTFLDGVSGTEKALSNVTLADRYSAALALHPVATMVTTLALGGLLGAAGHAGVASRKVPRRDAIAQMSPAQAAPPAAPVALPPATLSIEDLPALPSALVKDITHPALPVPPSAKVPKDEPTPNESPSAPDVSSLAEQVALLEVARGALGHNDASGALGALSAHARQFPNSSLTEEREALTIKSLLLAHRLGEAKSRMDQFEVKFPNSLLLPALRQSVGKVP